LSKYIPIPPHMYRSDLRTNKTQIKR
jgi:hypothetical protein